jgi:ribosomal protein S18 acetylase RimI-like enzyme
MVTVRRAQPEDAAAIARVQVDTWRSTYRGIVPDSYLDGLSYQTSQENWERGVSDPEHRTTVFVADDESAGVVGFAACGAARDTGWGFAGELYAIYLNRNMQRKGMGRSMVLSVAQDLKSRGFDSMLVWVLEDNPYKRFYESIGGRLLGAKEITMGGTRLRESGFGWSSIDSLISRLAAV